jgi:transposase
VSHQARELLSEFAVEFPCGHRALLNVLNVLNVLNSMIDKPQYSHRLQDMVIDMLSEYEITLKRLKDIEKQLGEFFDTSEAENTT